MSESRPQTLDDFFNMLLNQVFAKFNDPQSPLRPICVQMLTNVLPLLLRLPLNHPWFTFNRVSLTVVCPDKCKLVLNMEFFAFNESQLSKPAYEVLLECIPIIHNIQFTLFGDKTRTTTISGDDCYGIIENSPVVCGMMTSIYNMKQ